MFYFIFFFVSSLSSFVCVAAHSLFILLVYFLNNAYFFGGAFPFVINKFVNNKETKTTTIAAAEIITITIMVGLFFGNRQIKLRKILKMKECDDGDDGWPAGWWASHVVPSLFHF